MGIRCRRCRYTEDHGLHSSIAVSSVQRMSIFRKCLQCYECIIVCVVYGPEVAIIRYAGAFDELLMFCFLLCFSGKGTFIFFKTPSWLVSYLSSFLFTCMTCGNLEFQNQSLSKPGGTVGGQSPIPSQSRSGFVYVAQDLIKGGDCTDFMRNLLQCLSTKYFFLVYDWNSPCIRIHVLLMCIAVPLGC